LNDFIDADVFNTNFNDLLDNLWHLYDFLNGLVHRHQLLNDAVSGCWNLHGYYNRFLNLDDLLPLDVHIDNTLNLDFSWDFAYDLDDLLLDDLMNGRDLLTMDDFDGLVNDAVDNLLNLYVDVLDHFDLDDLLLDDRYLNNLLDLPNLLLNYNTVNGYLHNLWYLYDFLNNTRHNDDLLNDLLDFDYLGHLDHLIDDLFDEDTHFLNLFDVARYLHDLLFDVLDHTWYVDVMVDELLHFHDEWLLYDQRIPDEDFLHDGVLNSLDDSLRDDLGYTDQPLHNNGDFDTFLNDLLHFFDEWHRALDNLFDLLDAVLNHDFLSDNFNFLEFLNGIGNLHNLLYNLRHLDNLLFFLNDGNRLLNNPLDNPMLNLHVWDHLLLDFVVNSFHNLLYNLFDLNNLWDLHHLLHNFFYECWYFDNLLHNPLYWYKFLNHNLHLFDLGYEVVHLFLDCDNFVDLNYFLYDSFDFDDLGEFTSHFYDLFRHSWYFDHSLDDLLNRYDLFHNVVDNSRHFDGDIYNPLDLSDLLYLHNLLDDLLDWYHLRHFNHSIDNLLHNLFHFYDLGDHAEHLQHIIHIDNAHNFLIDHADYSLVDFQHSTSAPLELLQFLK
jgi:hypothetical protein